MATVLRRTPWRPDLALFWLGAVSLFLVANLLLVWACVALFRGEAALLGSSAGLDVMPRHDAGARCLASVLVVNAILTTGLVLFRIFVALERDRHARLGLPREVSEEAVFNRAHRGVFLPPRPVIARQKRCVRVRFDLRTLAYRPTRRTRQRL